MIDKMQKLIGKKGFGSTVKKAGLFLGLVAAALTAYFFFFSQKTDMKFMRQEANRVSENTK